MFSMFFNQIFRKALRITYATNILRILKKSKDFSLEDQRLENKKGYNTIFPIVSALPLIKRRTSRVGARLRSHDALHFGALRPQTSWTSGGLGHEI